MSYGEVMTKYLFCSIVAGLLGACSPETTTTQHLELSQTAEPERGDDDADGWPDELEASVGMEVGRKDKPCASAVYSQNNNAPQPPVDFILIIDNSKSMQEELKLVLKDLSEGFYPALEDSGLDYRVLVMTSAPQLADAVCPERGTCQGEDFNPDNKVLHLKVNVQSKDSLLKFLAHKHRGDGSTSMIGGWQEWLRPESDKIFLQMSDDESKLGRRRFEEVLRLAAGDFFYDEHGGRRFVWHSIIGGQLDDPAGIAQPDDPQLKTKCSSAVRPGLVYQRLSTLTRGLRFSICGRVPYHEVFDRIMYQSGVNARVPCTMELPYTPRTQRVDSSKLGIALHTSPQRAPELLARRADKAQCGWGEGFYVEAVSAKHERVQLCPKTCDRVQAQDKLTMRVAASCHDSPQTSSITHGTNKQILK